MLILEHKKQLIEACQPQTFDEWRTFWADIKPIKFGAVVQWNAAADYILASYEVPREAILVVMRVECYTLNLTAAAADFGVQEPPPPGTAAWRIVSMSGNVYIVTNNNAPTQLALDSDELLLFKGGYIARLVGTFAVSPDAATRAVRTTVYGYDCGPSVIERLGTSQVIIPPNAL